MASDRQTKPRVLYVESYADSADVFSIFLKESGYDVAVASTLDEGLELARSERYDLYLIAGILAHARGLDLCKKIREFDKDTPIVLFSVLAYKSDKKAGMEAGAQAYLVKPDDIGRLKDTISSLLKS
jgi:DNA-binding response OmpR family regulator